MSFQAVVVVALCAATLVVGDYQLRKLRGSNISLNSRGFSFIYLFIFFFERKMIKYYNEL